MVKRFTAEEKAEILDFVEKHGRGGIAAASRKYKVSANTIITWKKEGKGPKKSSVKKATKKVAKKAAKKTAKKAAKKSAAKKAKKAAASAAASAAVSAGFKKSEVRSVFAQVSKHQKEIASLVKKIQAEQSAIDKLKKDFLSK